MGVDSADGGGEMGSGEGSNSFGNEYCGGGECTIQYCY